MDWATFFKDNAQSIFTLGGVFLGSFITFLISYLNNRFQARERDKDREEQRREANIQNKLKWMERDILKIMDSIDVILKFLWDFDRLDTQLEGVREGKKSGLFSQDEVNARLKSVYDDFDKLHREVKQTSDLMGKLVHSLDENAIVDAYLDFLNRIRVHEETRFPNGNLGENPMEDFSSDNWIKIEHSAAKLHSLLREKLISLRE